MVHWVNLSPLPHGGLMLDKICLNFPVFSLTNRILLQLLRMCGVAVRHDVTGCRLRGILTPLSILMLLQLRSDSFDGNTLFARHVLYTRHVINRVKKYKSQVDIWIYCFITLAASACTACDRSIALEEDLSALGCTRSALVSLCFCTRGASGVASSSDTYNNTSLERNQ